ncbi:GIY-YIG nuclease family protein [Patescibacteria group bacterium]|nr:GIY-YIG nuclease family protein [Patescibacteria group bacterium]
MKYTYVLLCADKKLYIGSTADLIKWINKHKKGQVKSTKKRLPIKLVYYEACLSMEAARKREKYFRTGFGRRFLRNRINDPR